MIEQLGKPLTALAIHQRLGIGINQVYANARELGGVRIGKKWVFFEANVLQALGRNYADAKDEQTNEQTGVVRESNVQRASVHEKAPNKAGCDKMGAANKERIGKPAVNRHNLFVNAV
jgi:hypothetical protein